jgi:hypothetical protein
MNEESPRDEKSPQSDQAVNERNESTSGDEQEAKKVEESSNDLMETLDDNKQPAQSPQSDQQPQHQPLSTYLFLTKTDSTVILQMGSEITELEKETTSFCTKQPTILCANLCNNKYILQVTTNAFYLYKTITSECNDENSGPQLVNMFDLVDKLDARIKSAQLLDSFVGVLTENGKMLVYELNQTEAAFNLISPSLNSSTSAISCFSLYKDEKCGLLTKELMVKTSETAFAAAAELETNKNMIAGNVLANKSNSLSDHANHSAVSNKLNGSMLENNLNGGDMSMNVDDDEDELLYGASSSNTNLLDGSTDQNSQMNQKNPFGDYFTADKFDRLHERDHEELLRFFILFFQITNPVENKLK